MRSSPSTVRSARLSLEQLESRELLNSQSPLANVVPDEPRSLLVRYRSDASPVKIELADGQSLSDTLAAYRADPNVLYAEADALLQTQRIPNDTDFAKQWDLHNNGTLGTLDADVDAPEAWDVTTGSTKTIVAIIDTGVDYRHKDLYRNIWINQGEIPTAIRSKLIDTDSDGYITFWDLNDTRNQGAGKIVDVNKNGYIDGGDLISTYKADGTGGWENGISEDGDKYVDDIIGWNFVDNNNDPGDWNGHGTHIAGTIGATGNDGYGITGINWQIQMMAVRFGSSSGVGSTSTAIEALNYAVTKGATISNNSWAGGPYSQALYDAIDAARQKGHIFVTAAGNGGSDSKGDNIDVEPMYPASYNLNNIVAVTATTQNDKMATFSNYGATSVDVAAPGYLIYSTVPNNKYATYSGTSMAVPHVVGTLALLKSAHPDWTYTQLLSQMYNNVDKLSVLAGKVATGGRVSAGKAVLNAPADQSGPQLVAAVTNATGANPVSSVRVTFSEPLNVASFTTADVASFTGPNGAIAVSEIRVVTGSDNKQFDVIFATQSTAGTYRLVLGPNITDEAGNSMDQNGDGAKATRRENDQHRTRLRITESQKTLKG